MASEAELTPTSYIQHHLKNLTITVDDSSVFWQLHLDTLLMAVSLGLFMVFAFWLATRKATSGVPGKWQAFVEIVLEFVDQQARDAYPGRSKLVTPIAITLFCWILMMNLVKMIPADFFAIPLHALGVEYWKPVPSADVNATLVMSISVFFLMIFFALRAKGLGGFVHEFFTAPFGPWMFPANILLNIVDQAGGDEHADLQHRDQLRLAGGGLEELAGHDGQAQAGAQRGEADHDADGQDGRGLHVGEEGESFHGDSPSGFTGGKEGKGGTV